MPRKDPEARRTYMREHRRSRQAAGICGCGGQLEAGKSKCLPCLQINRARSINRTIQRGEQGLCVHCAVPVVNARLCDKCLSASRSQYLACRKAALAAYGDVCACCGETNQGFLTIDHVHNNGNQHRREMGSNQVYSWLKKNKYPGGFQVLCWNCQHGKHVYKVCPHKSGLRP